MSAYVSAALLLGASVAVATGQAGIGLLVAGLLFGLGLGFSDKSKSQTGH